MPPSSLFSFTLEPPSPGPGQHVKSQNQNTRKNFERHRKCVTQRVHPSSSVLPVSGSPPGRMITLPQELSPVWGRVDGTFLGAVFASV